MKCSPSTHPSLAQLMVLTLVITVAYAQYYTSESGIIDTDKYDKWKLENLPSNKGDYEFVLSGASDGGDRSKLKDKYLDRELMTDQGFRPLAVRGSKDCKSEAWVRENKGQKHIDISGNAKDVAYTVITMFKSEISFDINDITAATGYGGHGDNDDVDLNVPSEMGIKLVSFFFDDPVDVTGYGGGEMLFKERGFGDQDGYAAILYPVDVSPPSKLSIKNYDGRDPPPGEFASVVINIPIKTSGSTNTLHSNDHLYADDYIQSQNGRFKAIFQKDGNFVLYDNSKGPVWATATNRKDAEELVMQGDGNLVIYNSEGGAVWSSGTHGTDGKKLVLKDYGKLKIEESDGRDVKILN